MNYNETLDYLFSRLPMFQRIGAAAYKANLDNTLAIDNLLNHPHKNFKTIHIAGTNGKGSTSHMLASVLQEAGYKTGLYTSPHLIDFRERIKVNGAMISEEYVVDFVEKYKSNFEKIEPSFFEWTVGLAFDFFASENVDVAVIETGMGGRLDSTNIISPLLSIITNISFDHKQFLGNTLQAIAAEKAGIIKTKTPVVIGESTIDTKNVFIDFALKSNSRIFFADDEIEVAIKSVKDEFVVDVFENKKLIFENLRCGLNGKYQLKNIATVVKAIQILDKEFSNINEESIRSGIDRVVVNTGLMGRWQSISNAPKIICDTGHNLAGIEFIVEQLKELNLKKIHFVLGFVSDKDVAEILNLLPKYASYYFCEPSIPRAMKIEDLKNVSQLFFPQASYFKNVNDALIAAKKNCKSGELVFVGGSTFVVADLLTSIQKK